MKKKIFFLIFISLFFTFTSARTVEIKSLVTINNTIITNYDLIKNIELIQILENRNVSKNETPMILQNIIEQKVKELELIKYKIQIDQVMLNNKINLIVDKKDYGEKKKEIKEFLLKKIEIQEKWNKLIFLKFANKLEVNINEIDEIVKKNNLSNDERSKVLNNHKNRKINIISKTYFNEIKGKYLIKIL